MRALGRLVALGIVASAVIACSARSGTAKLHLRNVCNPDSCCDDDDDPDDGCCDPDCDGGGGGDDDDGGGGGSVVCWTNTTWCAPLCITSNISGCSIGQSSCLGLAICTAPTVDQCASVCGPGRHECNSLSDCPVAPPDLCHGTCSSDSCQICNNDLANPQCVKGCPGGRYEWDDAPGGCKCVPT